MRAPRSALLLGATTTLAPGLRLRTTSSRNGLHRAIPTNITDTTAFHYTDCINDELLVSGDKTGNPLAYSDAAHPISVIRYDKEVPKPKQEAMTHDVCFKFCKDQPHMQFFGLVRGSECYCSPYFVQAAGASQDCDMACEGNPGEMCGGQTKASVFEMHGRGFKASLLSEQLQSHSLFVKPTADSLKEDLDLALGTAKAILSAGKALADEQGKVGNKIALQHHQEMMASQNFVQSKIEKFPFDATADFDLLKSQTSAYKTTAATLGAQALTEMSKALNATAQKVLFDTWAIDRVAEMVAPKNGSLLAEKLQFYTSASVNEVGNPTDASCDGSVIMPISAVKDGDEGCAALCRKTLAPNTCVGFQTYAGYLENAAEGEVMCMLFSEIKSAVKYTGSNCGVSHSARCMVPVTSEPLRKQLLDTEDTIAQCFAELQPQEPPTTTTTTTTTTTEKEVTTTTTTTTMAKEVALKQCVPTRPTAGAFTDNSYDYFVDGKELTQKAKRGSFQVHVGSWDGKAFPNGSSLWCPGGRKRSATIQEAPAGCKKSFFTEPSPCKYVMHVCC
eukprot:g17993.t1